MRFILEVIFAFQICWILEKTFKYVKKKLTNK